MIRLRDPDDLVRRIRAAHEAIRDTVVAAAERGAIVEMATVVGEDAGDTLFAIDKISEPVLLEHFGALARDRPLLLIAEGLGHDGRRLLPEGTAPGDVEMVVIVDPIDGTRGLMYQKRPAWVLTGVAPARPDGRPPTLADIEVAVQTEVPLVKQHLCDAIWAIAGRGAQGERVDRLTGARRPLPLRPSRAATIAQGFGGIARFFPGARPLLSTIDDAIAEQLLGPPQIGRALTFEDQYVSSAGQLYELVMGHDRWTVDLRPLVDRAMRSSGRTLGICSHPYDLCTELVAREAGVIVTDPNGARLATPLDVHGDVAWVGYANPTLRDLIQPVLESELRKHKLWFT
jgi:fructose-1,6-bisphosphatase/inositol monophosphatase family enzyme